jgi:hypothetical protein
MARYQDNFSLDIDDIDRIERALRHEIRRHSVQGEERHASLSERSEIQALNRLLGKIHNQKVFYAQVKLSGVPAG